ncbi:hypothetical protein JST97_31700 [bacterium]|nr:hypothetical protein [bacterium]
MSIDFSDPDGRPYFLWSENMTLAELRQILEGTWGEELQITYTARIMRECRVNEVWQLLTLEQILSLWPRLQRRLGRSRKFWNYLAEVWSRHGLIQLPA